MMYFKRLYDIVLLIVIGGILFDDVSFFFM